MRNLAFTHTLEQVQDRTKTVTRRSGTWWSIVLKPGTLLCAVEKSQGIKKGELVRLCVIRVVCIRVETLDEPRTCGIQLESTYEGFPAMSWGEFVEMFCRDMGGRPDQIVTRIEFEYLEQVPSDTCGNALCRDDQRLSSTIHSLGFCTCECHGEEAFA